MNYDSELSQLWDDLIEHGACSEETLQVVTDGWGYNLKTLETVLYATTGYRNLEQWADAGYES